ncbi:hypothetical protein BGZ67_004501 [Mortierella alpina]|nr:hypothetical protein BGZ67_004501 [Mortierella alpina]
MALDKRDLHQHQHQQQQQLQLQVLQQQQQQQAQQRSDKNAARSLRQRFKRLEIDRASSRAHHRTRRHSTTPIDHEPAGSSDAAHGALHGARGRRMRRYSGGDSMLPAPLHAHQYPHQHHHHHHLQRYRPKRRLAKRSDDAAAPTAPASHRSSRHRTRHYSADGLPGLEASQLLGIHNPAIQPGNLTHLALAHYEFVLDEWIDMMRLMPSLQILDLEVIVGIPSLPMASRAHASGGRRSKSSSTSHQLRLGLWRMQHESGPAYDMSSDDGDIGCGDDGDGDESMDDAASKDVSMNQQYDNTSHRSRHHLERHVDIARLHLHERNPLLSAATGSNGLDRLRHSRHGRDPSQGHDASQAHAGGFMDHDIDTLDMASGSSTHQPKPEPQATGGEIKSSTSHAPNAVFPSVRTLIFRGPIIVPEMLEFLPNIENLSIEDKTSVPSPWSGVRPEGPVKRHSDVGAATMLSSSSSSASSSASSSPRPSPLGWPSIISDLAATILKQCPKIVCLQLSESSLVEKPQLMNELPLLLKVIPRLLHFVTSAGMVAQCHELLPALVRYHGPHLQSFIVIAEPQPRGQFQQWQQQHHPQHSYPQMSAPPPTTLLLHRQCLQVMETCTSLRISDCHVALPLQDILASIAGWSCRSSLTILRLEILELTGPNTMALEEVEVLEMFIKSLFIGSFSSSSSSSTSSLSSLSLARTSTGSTTSVSSTSTASTTSSGEMPAAQPWMNSSLLSHPLVSSPTPLTPSSTPPTSGKSSGPVAAHHFRDAHPHPSPLSSTASSASSASSFAPIRQDSDLGDFAAAIEHQRHHRSDSRLHDIVSRDYQSLPPGLSQHLPVPFPSPPMVSSASSSAYHETSSTLSSCSNHQIGAVGRLMALQCLVQHQLATMPNLNHFFLSGKMFKIPRRTMPSSTLGR